MAVLQRPIPGVYLVNVSGSGQVNIAVTAASTVQFRSFEFVEYGGRPDHEDYFAIEGLLLWTSIFLMFEFAGDPLAGQRSNASATLYGPIDNKAATFTLLALNGQPLPVTVSLSFVEDGGAAYGRWTFAGSFVVPAVPFRVTALGKTGGTAFQRVVSQPVHPQSLKLRYTTFLSYVKLGATYRVAFTLTNAGAADTVALSATASFNIVPTIVSPETGSLVGAGQSVQVLIDLPVPDDPSYTNSTAITLRVFASASHANGAAAIQSNVFPVLLACAVDNCLGNWLCDYSQVDIAAPVMPNCTCAIGYQGLRIEELL